MDALARAKKHAHCRRRDAGAVMFLVAMVLAVLASVGIYALAAAATEMRTSGNERQSTQTHYLSEYGVLGTAREMSGSKAQFYLGLMLGAPDSPCVSLPGVTSTNDIMLRACRHLASQELSQGWATPPTVKYTGSAPLLPSVAPGSLGPTNMQADFFVELTAPATANAPPRYALDLNICFIQLTATSVGLTQPLLLSDNSTVNFTGEGLEMQRARIIAGPIQCPK